MLLSGNYAFVSQLPAREMRIFPYNGAKNDNFFIK